jgi:MraZ protein
MLLGEYKLKLQDKKRLAFPNKLRSVIGKKFVITRGYEDCAVIMSPVQWEELVQNEISGPFVSGITRDTHRFLLASASEIELDPQGRFIVPDYICDYAALTKDVVFLGLGNWVEVWSKNKWDSKLKSLVKNKNIISEKLARIKLKDGI